MTTQEFSAQFDTLVNSYINEQEFGEQASRFDFTFDEYEKSVFLTKAQKELVYQYYSGKNAFNLSFEEKEELREALDTLVKTVVYTSTLPDYTSYTATYTDEHKTYAYSIPTNLLYIIFEEVKFASGSNCPAGKTALVTPATHDELWHRMKNPFRGPSKARVLRVNVQDNIVELISDYPIGSYLLRYVEEPKPIILIDLSNINGLSIDGKSDKTECALPSFIHFRILDEAVRLAVQSRMIGRTTGQKQS